MRSFSRLTRGLSRVVLFTSAAVPAVAGQNGAHELSFEVAVPAAALPSYTIVELPRFDPARGFLRAVHLRCRLEVQGSFALENLAQQNVVATARPAARAIANVTAISTPVMTTTYTGFEPVQLAAYDGATDHVGASAASHTFTWTAPADPFEESTLMSGALLSGFVASPNSSAPLSIGVTAWDASQFSAEPMVDLDVTRQLESRAVVTVVYEYDDTGAKFCGTGATWSPANCPCGNPGAGTNGCANAHNAAGAALDSGGDARLASDTWTLTASGLENGLAIFVQSDGYRYPSLPYGDGARCFSGSVVRLGIVSPAGGSASYPAAGQSSISSRGQVFAAGARYYTVYYRSSAPFCTGETFNATNSVAAYWLP